MADARESEAAVAAAPAPLRVRRPGSRTAYTIAGGGSGSSSNSSRSSSSSRVGAPRVLHGAGNVTRVTPASGGSGARTSWASPAWRRVLEFRNLGVAPRSTHQAATVPNVARYVQHSDTFPACDSCHKQLLPDTLLYLLQLCRPHHGTPWLPILETPQETHWLC